MREYECSEIIDFLDRRKGFLDGFVVSGGEPTLQEGLAEFLGDVKRLGYPVKLDTNGSSPDVVEDLLEKGLVDYIAMDVKAPFERYSEICGVPVDIKKISHSMDLLMQERVEYEFRTTVVSQLDKQDILNIAGCIKGSPLQSAGTCSGSFAFL